MGKLKVVETGETTVKRQRRTIEEREAMHAEAIAKARERMRRQLVAKGFESCADLVRAGAYDQAALQLKALPDALAMLQANSTPAEPAT